MAELSFPLNNTLYSAEEWQLFLSTRGSGIYINEDFPINIESGMSVAVGKGRAWLNYTEFGGIAYASTTSKQLIFAEADPLLDRIDRIVIQYNSSNNKVVMQVKTGVAGSVPTAPTINRTSEVYEISLYQIRIVGGSNTINVRNITDERLDESVCGLMGDSVTRINTAHISAALEADRAQFQLRFDTWFSGMQETLSGDVAGNLLNKINEVENSLANIKTNEYLTATLSAGAWAQEGGGYVQSVTVNGLDGMMALIDLVMSDTVNEEVLSNYKKMARAGRVGNAIKFFSPTEINADIPLKMLLFKGTGEDMFLMKYGKADHDKSVLLPNRSGLIYTALKEQNASITVTTEMIRMDFNNQAGGVLSWFYVSVDLTDYKTLAFDIYVEATHNDPRWNPCAGVLKGTPTTITTFPPACFTAYRSTVLGTSTYTVDVSGISGMRAVGMVGVTRGSCTGIRLVR